MASRPSRHARTTGQRFRRRRLASGSVGDTVGVEAAVGGRGLLLVCMVSGLEEGPKITSFDSIAARRVSERRFLRDADKTAEKAKEAALWSAASITALFFS